MTETTMLNDGTLCVADGTEEIEEEAFAARAELRRVIVPEGVRRIGAGAFSECEKLEEAVLPQSLRQIGEGAFLLCTALREIRLPEGLEQIDDMAFWGSGLERIRVPNSVRRIGETAFWACEKLRRADVLGEDTRIGINAFGCCRALVEGYIAPGFPEEQSNAAELLYTLLWCSCVQKHSEKTSQRARQILRSREALIMETIFRNRNLPALSGLVRERLLKEENLDGYIRFAGENELVELTALLLQAKANDTTEEEWTL